uniref:Uncharacterized protein LOC111099930 isoform X2 n=1 Tax=Crassostrea virginica TaxID=6565 RepID=A0A8B8A6S8_CRAVI|nr:uncharacterized protein LOC111099930 isoform X2 [Crassostrea virginica]
MYRPDLIISILLVTLVKGMTGLDTCPSDLREKEAASLKLGCDKDKYGNDQYVCLPRKDKTSLLEVCYDDVMGLVEKNNCVVISEGKLIYENCEQFSKGCPAKHFKITELYNYPACSNINMKHFCFVLNPTCGHNVREINWTIIISIIFLACIFLLVIGFGVFYCKRRRRMVHKRMVEKIQLKKQKKESYFIRLKQGTKSVENTGDTSALSEQAVVSWTHMQ